VSEYGVGIGVELVAVAVGVATVVGLLLDCTLLVDWIST